MAKLCRCGKIVKDRCDCISGQSVVRRNVTSEGHGQDHRLASERYRANHPLCERCVMLYGAVDAKPSKDMHHIHSIRSAPHLRMDSNNWLAVCGACHEDIEGDSMQGMEIKRWSERAYSEALEGSIGLNPGVSEKIGSTVADRSRSLPCGSAILEV